MDNTETADALLAPDKRHAKLAFSVGLTTAIWLIAVSRWISLDVVVPWDSKNQFYAFFRFLCAALAAADSPLWNPYHYGGHPSVADPQSLIFAPVFIIWAALGLSQSMRVFDLLVFAHLLAGGIALNIFASRMRWPVSACVLAAALFMLGGPASGRLQHTGIILSYSLFPVALLLLHSALERCSHITALSFAMVAACLALGRNQVALLLCVLLIVIAATEILAAPRPSTYLRERLGVLMTMGGTGCLLLSIPMLLTLQFARLSNRPDEVLQDALQGSLHPSNLAGLAVPNIFGSHNTYWGPGAATLQAVALTDDSFNYLFIGVVPLLLLLWLGAVGGSIWRPGRGVMAAALVVSGLFMLGQYTPLYSLAFQFVPGVGLFRRPTDASFVFEIAASILAGYCLADYVREGIPPLRVSRLIAVTTAWVGIVCWAIIFSARTNHGVEAALEAGPASCILLVAVFLLVWGKHMQARAAAASLLTLIAAAELLWWNAASRLNAENHSLYAVLETPTGVEANAIAILEKAIDDDHRRGNYPRVEIVGLGGPWQNLAMVRGWEASNGYNPLRIGIYDRLVAPGEENWNAAQRRFPPSFEGYDSALARALGLTYLILGQPIDRMPSLATVPDVDLLYAESPIWIYRLRGPMPRVRLVARVEVANADALNAEGGLPLQPSMERVLVDDARPPLHSYVGSVPNVIGEVNFVARRATHLELVTTSEIDTFLVVHDTFYPGWVAEIDGVSVPILRADLLFRGVEVPAGTHQVTMRFAPFAVSNFRTAIGSASGQK